MIRRDPGRPFSLCLIAAVFAAVVWAAPAWAGSVRQGAISIDNAYTWVPPAKARTGAVYMTIANDGKEEDTLLSASTNAAEQVELHTMSMEGDVMRMRHIPSIAIPAGKPVSLAPGGVHLMLIGIKDQFRQGADFPLELKFAKAGSVTVGVSVKGRD